MTTNANGTAQSPEGHVGGTALGYLGYRYPGPASTVPGTIPPGISPTEGAMLVQAARQTAINEVMATVQELEYIDNYGRGCCHVKDLHYRLDAMLEGKK